MKKAFNILFFVGMLIYLYLVSDLFFRFSVLFDFGREVERNVNLIPFKTILEYIQNPRHISSSLVADNLLGNILVFVPLGLYIQTLLKDKAFFKSLMIVIAATVFVELAQFAFAVGSCDIDDVILNTVGGIIGILTYKLLRRVCRSDEKVKRIITVASLVVGLPLLIFYLMMEIRIQ